MWRRASDREVIPASSSSCLVIDNPHTNNLGFCWLDTGKLLPNQISQIKTSSLVRPSSLVRHFVYQDHVVNLYLNFNLSIKLEFHGFVFSPEVIDNPHTNNLGFCWLDTGKLLPNQISQIITSSLVRHFVCQDHVVNLYLNFNLSIKLEFHGFVLSPE